MKKLIFLILLFASCNDAELPSTVVSGIKPNEKQASYIPYSPTGGSDTISTQAYVTKRDVANVKLTGNQTIGGTKTLSYTTMFSMISTGTNPSFQIKSKNPQYEVMNTDAGANTQRWNVVTNSSGYFFRLLNDAGTLNKNVFQVGLSGGTLGSMTFTPNVKIINQQTSSKFVIGKYDSGSSHSDAPTTLGIESQYITLGALEYGTNSYRTIGFGYVAGNTVAPASMGYQETKSIYGTFGDLIFNTRATYDNQELPVTKLRVTSDGKIKAENGAVFVGGGLPTVVVDVVLKTLPTSASLNTKYPDAPVGSSVYATSMPGGAQQYIKISATQWTGNPISVL